MVQFLRKSDSLTRQKSFIIIRIQNGKFHQSRTTYFDALALPGLLFNFTEQASYPELLLGMVVLIKKAKWVSLLGLKN